MVRKETEVRIKGSCSVACGFGESLKQSTKSGTVALDEEVRRDREACWDSLNQGGSAVGATEDFIVKVGQHQRSDLCYFLFATVIGRQRRSDGNLHGTCLQMTLWSVLRAGSW